MIYLFSQIAISLALAAIAGGAIGWIMHRARVARQIHQLQDIVYRQQQQVSEAQTEVNILTADFDDLKQTSESKISKLKKDNREIPALNQNLEKSQLLVRQLMEQHKTELDETNDENEKLLARSKQIDDREKEIIRLQAELDIERRKTARSDAENAGKTAPSAHTGEYQRSTNDTDTRDATSHTRHAGSRQYPRSSNNTNKDAPRATTTTPKQVRLPLSANSVSSGVDPATENTVDSNDDTLPSSEQTQSELAELRDQLADDVPTTAINQETSDQESNSNFVEVSPNISESQKLVETEVDDTSLEQMFDTVDQRDDLKQIFGIGPVTEKTLNKLGITAYSQLAELKQHDIEKIANALQIFPSRIERDNWVGGARAQLEEVLEDL